MNVSGDPGDLPGHARAAGGGEVRLDVDAGTAIITLGAPERRNALTASMASELVAVCEQVDGDASIGAVVVCGDGGYFCAGAHRALLRAAGADPWSDATVRGLSAVYDAFTRVAALKVPSVAAVRGGAVGAGMNLALASDLRIVAGDAILSSGFLRLGIHPGGGHFGLLARVAPRDAVAALGLFGADLDGCQAAALGLAWEAVADDRVEARALELASAAARDPELARRAKSSFRVELDAAGWTPVAGVEMERMAQLWSLGRASARRGEPVSASGGDEGEPT